MVRPAGDQVFHTWGWGRHFIFKPQDTQWKSLSEQLNEQISSQLCYLSQSKSCLYLDETSLKSDGRKFQVSWGQVGKRWFGTQGRTWFLSSLHCAFLNSKHCVSFPQAVMETTNHEESEWFVPRKNSRMKYLRVGVGECRAVCRKGMIYDTCVVHSRDNKNSGIPAEVGL